MMTHTLEKMFYFNLTLCSNVRGFIHVVVFSFKAVFLLQNVSFDLLKMHVIHVANMLSGLLF